MLVFNLSPSSLNMYKDSELMFYYNYISKEFPDTQVPQCYGKGGNIVHHILEKYANGQIRKEDVYELFKQEWKLNKMSREISMNGRPLEPQPYLDSIHNGIYKIDNKYRVMKTETMYKFPLRHDSKFRVDAKGIIDVEAKTKDGVPVLVDWKTSNSITEDNNFKRQGLFYAYLFYKYHRQNSDSSIVCDVVFEYLKLNKSVTYRFNEHHVIKFEKYLHGIMRELEQKYDNITHYKIGNIDSPFNQHKLKCVNEYKRRKSGQKITKKIELTIKNNNMYIMTRLPDKLNDYISQELSFEDENSHFITGNWDGIYRLYNKNTQSFRIGLVYRVLDILRKYCDDNGYVLDYIINDSRDEARPRHDIFKQNNINLRDYQIEAVETAMKRKIGIVQMPTSSGKTEVFIELTRRLALKTLVIVNRKELLRQTKERMEKAFGFEVGTITDGEINDKWVNVATIQTLVKKKDEKSLRDIFNRTQHVICDETHIVASNSFRKVFGVLNNSIYRFGFSATPFRDDGKEMFIEEGVGRTFYTVDKTHLINEGYIMRPVINFLKVPSSSVKVYTDSYHADYEESVVNNEKRNELIIDLVERLKGKKIMILVKMVDHGKMLMEQIPNSFYLHGSLSKKQRDEKYDEFVNGDLKVMIATMSIASEGLNIPNLDVIINVGANKGDVKSLQVLGRVMRVFDGKKKAEYWDFIDAGKYTKAHSNARCRLFRQEEYEVNIIQDIKSIL